MRCKINLNNLSLFATPKKHKYISDNYITVVKGQCWYNNNTISINKIKDLDNNKLAKIQGNFVIILINKKNKLLEIIVDGVASDFLYYNLDKNKLILSDNINKLDSYFSLNMRSVNKYLKNDIIPTPHTIYKKIYKLKPGIFEFNYKNKKFIKKNNINKKKISLSESLKEIPSQIKNYKRKRKLAVLATGGLDSSFLAAISKKMRPVLFFAAIDDSAISEYNTISIKKCKRLSKQLKLPFKIIKINKRDFVKNAIKVVKLMDGPIKDYDLLAVYSLFEKISEKIPSACIISGIGANELFDLPKKHLEDYLYKKIPSEIKIHKKIAKKFGLDFFAPYLSTNLVNYSLGTHLKAKKNKIPLKREIEKKEILTPGYINQTSQHSEIPNSFFNLLNTLYPPLKNNKLKIYLTSTIVKKIKKQKEIILPLWLEKNFLNLKEKK
ncbi:hypothetical protein K9M16_05190 [Candidatus Babeliales bacterium]|nr:hypothetical protein [Candidatus Babeliales bacterium]